MPRSLTVRLALLFALLCLAVLGTVGLGLYRGLETQLTLRDDAALVNRVEQIRTLLQDANTMQLVHEKPQLFENMLGNREALLVLRFPGEKPLIEVNPGGVPVPDLDPVAASSPLLVAAVHRSVDAGGTPFAAVAANARTAEPGRELRITAGRVMSERTRILESYRERILLLVGCGTALAALAAFALVARSMRPLRDLAEQTATIRVSNLTARIDVSRAPRELAPLIDSFNAMLERLAASFAQLSQVSADMAHDLRTPIGNLLGQTEVALGQSRSADYYHDVLASNLEELQRLSRMTDNMLFLARSDHSDAETEPAWLDVAGEFERVADYFEGLADERGLRIVRDGVGLVWADPMLLRRALANLLANAVQYADASSTIVLSAQARGAGVALSVENDGPQIGEQQLSRLFERFYRADTARRGSAQSSGLGLSIVRTIMTLHRGEAQARSGGGKTSFTLVFPAARAALTRRP
jgi:two-component system heavy metal sensor histidine kinase CusS